MKDPIENLFAMLDMLSTRHIRMKQSEEARERNRDKGKTIALPQLIPGVAWGYGPSGQCEGCGNCCTRMPGAYFPHDIKDLNTETLVDGMVSRKWIADTWVGDPREGIEELDEAYYIRPRTTNDPEDYPYYESWGGTCSNLTDEGCKLEWHTRPTSCRSLVPRATSDDDCVMAPGVFSSDQDKSAAATAWIPYNDIIKDAIEIAYKAMNEGETNEPV